MYRQAGRYEFEMGERRKQQTFSSTLRAMLALATILTSSLSSVEAFTNVAYNGEMPIPTPQQLA